MLVLDKAKDIIPKAFLICRYSEIPRTKKTATIAPPNTYFGFISLFLSPTGGQLLRKDDRLI